MELTAMNRLTAMLLALGLALSPFAAQAQTAPQRIVSIGGAVTEILYTLGVEDRVVGIDSTSVFPPRALQEKENVGYLRQLSAEGVLALSPDLIIMDEGAGPPETVALIDAAGVPVRHVPTGHTIPELLEKVSLVSDAVGRADAGEAMASRLAQEFAALERDLAAVGEKRRVLFVYSLVDGRPNAAGRDTGADAIIDLAGAENVFAEVSGYKALSLEAAAALAPETILLIDRPGQETIDPLSVPALAATPAGQSGSVIRMDASYLLGFGPRTPAAARDLARQLYPDLDLSGGALVR